MGADIFYVLMRVTQHAVICTINKRGKKSADELVGKSALY